MSISGNSLKDAGGALFSATSAADQTRVNQMVVRRTYQFPKLSTLGTHIADAMAADTTTEYTALQVPYAGKLVSVKFVSTGTATADASNNATVTLKKYAAAGGAGVSIATYTSDVAGGSIAAQTQKSMTLTSTAADLLIAAGDNITVAVAKTGTGVALPKFVVIVEVEET